MSRFLKKTTIFTLICVFFILAVIICSPNDSIFSAYASDKSNTVILGGTPIGIIADSNGLVVNELINVTSNKGSFSPALKAGIKKGDVILSVNGENITNIADFNDTIQSSNGYISLKIKREDQEIVVNVFPEFDIVNNSKKIGLAVKNNIAGIGTMTYRKNNHFAALGHRIGDAFGNDYIYHKGKIYECEITGYNRATENTPGELVGKIYFDQPIGTIEKNTFSGIYGENKIETSEEIAIEMGSKNDVTPGKAFIYTTINGEKPQKYEIEIIKKTQQNSPAEKGMVIRVTDKKLLETTGGILQGMSGSPIVQNEKLIGAVTHVFTNDSKIGYGIYIDWMEKELSEIDS